MFICCNTMLSVQSDEHFMSEALKEARIAFEKEEVPIGAIIVAQNRIIARAHNLTEQLNDVTAHAEMQAMTSAFNYLGGKYLVDCTLYVTLEPCVMCAGALYWSQISRIVFGAYDLKRGYSKLSEHVLHPKTFVAGGLLEEESLELLQSFFKKRRA
jgi:tRNA(adenine34) deaminase